MTDWTMQSTGNDPRQMLGAFVRARTDSAKDLARRIGCDPRSAEGYRKGLYWPQAKHWPGIVGAFGRDVVDAVFFPADAAARLSQEVADLEAKLAEARAELRVVTVAPARRGPRVASLRPGSKDRAAVSPAD